MDSKTKQPDINTEIVQSVYKTATMGTDASVCVIGKTDDEKFRSEMTAQLDGFQGFANTARTKLTSMNAVPKEIGVMQKIPAEMSISIKTMVDNSPSKIAEMVINGTTMGLIEVRRALNKGQSSQADADCLKIASDMTAFQEQNIEKLKTFL